MTDQTTNTVSEWASWPLDREIVIARIVDADRETAFEAWTDPAQIVQWFGPDGFLIESYEADIRAGGVWRFDMVAPDGTRFSNRMDFLRIEAPHLIELDHGQDVDDDPDRFRLLVTFDEQDNGKPLSPCVRCTRRQNVARRSSGLARSSSGRRRWANLPIMLRTRPRLQPPTADHSSRVASRKRPLNCPTLHTRPNATGRPGCPERPAVSSTRRPGRGA